MKILILNWRDPTHPLAGGAEVMLLEHAKYWVKKGNDVIWFSASYKNAKPKEEYEGIRIIRRGSHITVKIWAMFLYLSNHFKKVDILVDCFHFHPFFTPLYSRKPRIALIHEVAGKIWFYNIAFPIALIGYLTEPFTFLFYKNTPFITVSKSTNKELKKIGIKKTYIIENGVKVSSVKNSIKKEDAPTVIFLGRLSKDKGVEDAVLAVAKTHEVFKNIQLWLVGKPENLRYLKQIKAIIKKENLTKNTKIFGYVSEKEKMELLKRSWLLIHPSKKEGWGLTVIEAATQETPAVGYNVEGLRDSIKHGETGILVESNPEFLGEELLKLLQNKKKLRDLGKNARIFSTKFSWDAGTKKSLEVIKKYAEK